MKEYASKDNLQIVRDDSVYPDQVALIDEEGDCIFLVPDTWMDSQVWKTLEIVNEVFDKGIRLGADRKIREIKNCLDIGL